MANPWQQNLDPMLLELLQGRRRPFSSAPQNPLLTASPRGNPMENLPEVDISGVPMQYMSGPSPRDIFQQKLAQSVGNKAVIAKENVQPLAVAPVKKGSGMTNMAAVTDEEKAGTKDMSKFSNAEANYLSPEELSALYERTAGLDTFQEQKKGLGQMRNLLAMEQGAPVDYISRPIAGLLQNAYGKSGAAAAMGAGQTPEEQRAKILDYVNKIQGGQKDLSKNIFEAIGKQRSGMFTTTLGQDNFTSNLLKTLFQNTATDPNKFVKTGAKGYDPSKDVTAHQKRMEGLQGVLETYGDLDTELGGVENWKGSDIPGVGATAMMPSGMLSDKGSKVQQLYSDLKNQLIYMRSGKQINESEFRRLSVALGSGITGTDREFMSAIKKFGQELKGVMQQKEAAIAGTHPEVLNLYKKGGGTLSSDFVPPSEREAKTKKAPTKKASEMSEAELDAYLASHEGK